MGVRYLYFNTSYVMVQLLYELTKHANAEFQYILCYGSTLYSLRKWIKIIISIHLMLWFNVVNFLKGLVNFLISIHLMLWFNIYYNPKKTIKFKNFNTSYVMVQRLSPISLIPFLPHFNTSYVMVQLVSSHGSASQEFNFNTSYVMVQHFTRITKGQ